MWSTSERQLTLFAAADANTRAEQRWVSLFLSSQVSHRGIPKKRKGERNKKYLQSVVDSERVP